MDSKHDTADHDAPLGAIAIVGMSGRFPGAANLAKFWRNLCAGVDAVTHFSDAELEDSFPPEIRHAANFVKARPILSDVELFDAPFFGMYAREAELTDPQHRLFLEICWEALEDAGYDPAAYQGPIGVFAGSSPNTYFLNNVLTERRTTEEFTSNYQVGMYPMLLGAGADFLSTRVSYKLDLKGPSLTLQTACSTSLLAVAKACQSLLLYESDMALAGGVSITLPQKRGYQHLEGGMVSADGTCRPFDADATGTIFGSGAGVVLLKRLEDAIADGDHVYAVIRGSGVNNDGAGKVGFTAPSVAGQAAVIEMALAASGVEARSISYVECHGTATPMGDPIEIAGLTKAFAAGTPDLQFCAIGSVKSNVGHLDAAAGVTGLIKTALALKYRQLPPSLHYRSPNPQIDFANTPFFVNDTLRRMAARQRAAARRRERLRRRRHQRPRGPRRGARRGSGRRCGNIGTHDGTSGAVGAQRGGSGGGAPQSGRAFARFRRLGTGRRGLHAANRAPWIRSSGDHGRARCRGCHRQARGARRKRHLHGSALKDAGRSHFHVPRPRRAIPGHGQGPVRARAGVSPADRSLRKNLEAVDDRRSLELALPRGELR